MDSNEHEKERGITISSKYTRLYYKGSNQKHWTPFKLYTNIDHTLHVVDTPGHADFGGYIINLLIIVVMRAFQAIHITSSFLLFLLLMI